MTLDHAINKAADECAQIDITDFLLQFGKTEVYVYLENNNETSEAPSEDGVKIRTARLGTEEFVMFFIDKNDDRLSQKFAGLLLENAVLMTLKNPNTSGMLLQGSGTAWLVLRSQSLRAFLDPGNTASLGQRTDLAGAH